MKRPIIGGIYRHYKSKGDFDHVYKVTSIAKHSETDELFVVYEALYTNEWLAKDKTNVTIRPLNMFLEKIDVNGVLTPRFSLIFDPWKF